MTADPHRQGVQAGHFSASRCTLPQQHRITRLERRVLTLRWTFHNRYSNPLSSSSNGTRSKASSNSSSSSLPDSSSNNKFYYNRPLHNSTSNFFNRFSSNSIERPRHHPNILDDPTLAAMNALRSKPSLELARATSRLTISIGLVNGKSNTQL